MRAGTTAATVLALLALALAGCTGPHRAVSNGDHASSRPPGVPAGPAAPTSDTPASAAAADPLMKIGTAWPWQQGDTGTVSGATTVLSYQQHIAVDGPTPEDAFGPSSRGDIWASLDVKVCSNPQSTAPIPVADTDWTLTYSDGTRIKPSGTGYDNFPKPAFPMGDSTVQPGRCLRGKIVFPVPAAARPVLIDYTPGGMTVPEEWTVPEK
ncbi:hypothetical protein [Streptacidiphilus cavernicola]|uniref:DUF4352 domain-containing protein n=1 Tax=Streptacidiphilus cavernicola TaxID=3342716 RepID=A0ABV6VRL5_9ACTN